MQLNWSRNSVDSSGLLRSLCPCRFSSLPPIMSVGRLLRPPRGSRSFGGCGTPGQSKIEGSERWMARAPSSALSSCLTSNRIPKSLIYISRGDKRFSCNSFARPDCVNNVTKLTAVALARSHDILHRCPLLFQLIPAVSIIAFAVWGFEPVLFIGNLHHKNDANWKKSRMHHVLMSCLRPVMLCIGVILMCRALDPISLASESSQAVKQRFLNFVRSLATVLAFAFCSSSMIEQMQKFYAEQMPSSDSRSMGFQFTGKAIYTAMWVAALSLFMELLGFSTQKWLTAGGLGTVLLTLAGREIFTNFLSSLMIHATRPFVVNDWIQTKIEGYEVSGTVERVGWWSPTIIRGEDQEAVHIPNHKFSVNVVRNLSQKTHWRIKTHLAISHLDAKKISNIVADMRKVLAKNPQIEQQRIHRRIFLDYIDTENQAFMILVSCFVRTSYFEEYLCVKEAVLLDLLRVIGHHGARLATPIRTVNKTYSDPDLDDMPFADTTFTRRRHSLFLPEILSRINGDEKPRGHYTPILSKEQPSSTTGESEWKDTSTMEVVSSGDSLSSNGGIATVISKDRDLQNKVNDAVMAEKKTQSASRSETELLTGVSEMAGSKATDSCIGAVKEMAPSNHLGNEQRVSDISPMTAQAQQETERSHFKPPPASRSLENNIILGVALDGAKRTLPIEEQLTKEFVACKNVSELSPLPMDKQDAQTTAGGMLTEQGRG